MFDSIGSCKEPPEGVAKEDELLESNLLPPRLNGHDELPLGLYWVLGELWAGTAAKTLKRRVSYGVMDGIWEYCVSVYIGHVCLSHWIYKLTFCVLEKGR